MSYSISQDCIGCSACTVACQVNAIVKVGDKYKIIKEKCISCGDCVSLCPINVITKNGEKNENSNSNR